MPRQTIGRYHLKTFRMLEKSIKIERQQLVGKFIIKQPAVEDATLSNQMPKTDIFIPIQVIDIGNTGTTGLATDIRHTIASTCRNSHRIWEIQIVFHEGIQYPACKHTSHSASFQDQSRFSFYLHTIYLFFLFIFAQKAGFYY